MLRSLSKMQSARSLPAFQWETASIGLLTVAVDVFADKLDGHGAAALVRHVGQLIGCCRALDGDRDDLVFLLGACAAHFEFAVFAGFDGFNVVGSGLVSRSRR